MRTVYIPRRWVFVMLGHAGLIVLFTLRVNLGIAIVAMVNATDISSKDDLANECSTKENGSLSVMKSHQKINGAFDWKEVEQGYVLSAFFYGYLLTQIPAGILSHRLGAKHVFSIGIIGASVTTLLAPVASQLSLYALIAVRFIEGLLQGITIPAIYCMLAKWCPHDERSRMVATATSGIQTGSILAMSVGAFLSDTSAFGGWESSFYCFGSAGLLFTVVWMFLAYEDPSAHPNISSEEKQLITLVRDHVDDDKKLAVPWMSLCTSPAIWATIYCFFCKDWVFFLVMTGLPSYYKHVLGFDLKENGGLSALPFIAAFLSTIFGGFMSDHVRKKYLSTTQTRKLITCVAFIPASMLLIAASYAGCNQGALSVFCITVATGSIQLNIGGFMMSVVDMSPQFSGLLAGLSNTAGTLAGCLVPIVTGTFIENEPNRDQYRKVFALAAGLATSGAIVFLIWGSGEEQHWSKNTYRSNTKKTYLKDERLLTHDSTETDKVYL